MITLTKHHGLGNDFLVLDLASAKLAGIDSEATDWPGVARRLCNRSFGIGADGLLLLEIVGPEELTMVLYNADGSRAEMSGNGIRCLAQAAFMIQHDTNPTEYSVMTDAGVKQVSVTPVNAREINASVSMGAINPLDTPQGWDDIGADPLRPVMHLGLGNPHSVVGVDDVIALDLQTLGQLVPQVNLEVIQPGPTTSSIIMRVHERGAGITLACGTGACVSAWAAAQWGLATPADNEIRVHMDGGDATVRLHQPLPGHVTLVGPAVFVARIETEIS
jgi:diaminopimelate epimerase